MLFNPNEDDSDYSDIEQGQNNDIKQDKKPSIGQELGVIALVSGLSAAANSVGAAVLAKADYVGYEIAGAAGIGGFGSGILCTLVFVANRVKAAMSGESKCLESKCVQEMKAPIRNTLYSVGGTLLGWGILKWTNLTSMEFDQALYSNLTGAAILGGGLGVAACCGLAFFACKQKPEQLEVLIRPSENFVSLN